MSVGGATVSASFVLNGERVELRCPVGERLLDTLRDELGLIGTKEACGRGECGACTVLVDGRPVMGCLTLTSRVRTVETIEGLREESRPLREAFARHGGFQCGFCTPGQIVRGVALLRDGVPDDEAALRAALSGNICRCTGYAAIVTAVRNTASLDAGAPGGVES
jgi:aerobic-type carbon monoxide dehydrogenase small subunit (CoxS/CutS family)